MKSKILTSEEMKAIVEKGDWTPEITCPGSTTKLSCFTPNGTKVEGSPVTYDGNFTGLVCDNGTTSSIECCPGYVVANVTGTNQYTCVPKPTPDPNKPDPNPGGGNGTGSEGGSGDDSGDTSGDGSGTGTGTGSDGNPTPNPTGTESGKKLL